MSNYYSMSDGKARIAEELIKRGWKVYNYSPAYFDDDPGCDYSYNSAHWYPALATKNGYTLVIDMNSGSEQKEITQYNPNGNLSASDREKVNKLERMTTARGCTPDEENTAKKLIADIQSKINGNEKYIVVDIQPGYMANPGKSKWHIEKDNKIFDKGTGITKYSDIPKSYEYDITKMEFTADHKYYYDHNYHNLVNGEYISTKTERTLSDDVLKIVNDFKALILRFERVVNGMNSCGDGTAETAAQAVADAVKEELEHITVTEYRSENKTEETTGDIIIGADFILKSSFNYNCYKGLVYHIDDIRNGYIYSKKYNGKLTKLCEGTASTNNRFSVSVEKLKTWIEKGTISLVNIVEVKTPYEVDKWVRKSQNQTKKQNKTEQQTQNTVEETEAQTAYTYDIKQDIDTRDNSTIYVVKVIEKLSKEEYIKVNEFMRSIGGYYSKFKHGFIFKDDPTETLTGGAVKAETKTETKSTDDYYKQSEIEDGYLYDCHFKEWNYNINDIKTMVRVFDIEYIDMGNKIGFKGLTAEQAKQVKEISDSNGSVFFVDVKEKIKTDDEIRQEQEKEQEAAQAKRQKLIEKIDKQIESAKEKIMALSGDYKTNTWKRTNEQANRESKKEGYQLDINILEWLKSQLYDRDLTQFEECLIISAFRDSIHSYWRQHEYYTKTAAEKRNNTSREIKYPSIDYSCPLDGYWNQEVPKKQKQLNKAGITNTDELLKAVEYYGEIYKQASKPIDRTAQRIKQLESECKLKQKGDINFTPSSLTEKLLTIAQINADSRVLEPSAGIGSIADQIKKVTNNIDVIECMSDFRELLTLKGYSLVGYDFLEYTTENLYDYVIMNPPFSNEQEHIKHAYSLLKDGGMLISITSPHWTFANDKKAVQFREWVENENSYTIDVSSGTFEMTGVATKILVIEKPEQATSKTA